ncbi:hypothetical protein STEG23_028107 [Scotinomys teguina]
MNINVGCVSLLQDLDQRVSDPRKLEFQTINIKDPRHLRKRLIYEEDKQFYNCANAIEMIFTKRGKHPKYNEKDVHSNTEGIQDTKSAVLEWRLTTSYYNENISY